jgi:hypothetical protein
MDALSPEETKEVEANLAQYPELKQELSAIQDGLALFASTYAQKPNRNLKSRVLGALPFEDDKIYSPPTNIVIPKLQDAKIIPIQSGVNKWLVAASIALLISTSWLVYRNTEYSKRIADLETRITSSEQEFADLNARFTTNTNYLANISSPETKKILLSSKTKNLGENAVLFLNPKDASVLITIDQLAEIPESNQYQLWALVDGKPIDMGVLNSGGIRKAKNIPELLNAQAFAITIEKKGGSPIPTLEKLVAVGATS